jgi:hypothetical protein
MCTITVLGYYILFMQLCCCAHCDVDMSWSILCLSAVRSTNLQQVSLNTISIISPLFVSSQVKPLQVGLNMNNMSSVCQWSGQVRISPVCQQYIRSNLKQASLNMSRSHPSSRSGYQYDINNMSWSLLACSQPQTSSR